MGLSLNPGTELLKTNQQNVLTFHDLYQRLKSIALVMFKWENLPNDIPGYFIEQSLYQYGQAGFFNDPTLGYMVTKINTAGKLNIYDQPVRYQAWAIGYSKQYDRDDLVVIKNNYLTRATHETLLLYANRLYEVERSAETNIKLQKYPLIIRGQKSMLMSLKNIFMKYDGNQPAIYADPMLDDNAIRAIKTDVPYVADKLLMYKHELWNECMTFLGINNINGDKKERLIVDEANANSQLIKLSADVMLSSRQDAVKQINEKYGLAVSVSLRQEFEETPEFMFGQGQDESQGGEEIG
jgi:hypothetical protein